jgi:hypothetical protein
MDHLSQYLARLNKALAKGDATEHTHRAALQALMEASAHGLEATNEPKAQQRENKPDYLIRRKGTVIGYVEAKDVGQDLKRVIKSAQIKRYLEALPNLIITNYVDFVWFAHGQEQMRISLGDTDGWQISTVEKGLAQWPDFFTSFCNAVTNTLSSPSQLAQALAGQTRLLRDLVLELTDTGDADLKEQHEAFKTLLVPELLPSEFADMYAQTATYGLFTARVFEHNTLFGVSAEKLPAQMRKQGFTLEKAAYLIPKVNPFLREFFQHIANPNLSEQLRWLIEQIASSLNHTDIQKVLLKQSRRQGFEDPVFHFYETFLAAYDPRLREQRGVYYTPEPVVDFIVRSVDALLIEHFGRQQGLADPDTLILDPATGTATFLRRVIEAIHQRVTAQDNTGLWSSYVRERLLPRVLGFELMMAPYTVAHLKLALQLQESGAQFDKGQRLHVYLTNTLDSLQHKTGALLGQWIARENEGAERVKRHEPVQVVLGNPPYSGESKNKGRYILALLDEYKKEPEGGPLKERNSKWINDDYVKFIRFAHDRVVRTGHGIVAFITNHSWLDNPTFRGMRASLMRDFDDIYVIDLHGNAKKKERTPEALRAQGDDKNVFDIEQGVAITFLIKLPDDESFLLEIQDANISRGKDRSQPRKARIHHAELWGSREHKYDWLHQHALERACFKRIEPALPQLLFVPRNESLATSYEQWWKVTDILPVNSVGIVTARDSLTIHFTQQELEQAIQTFSSLPVERARQQFNLGKDSRDWRVEWAQSDLNKTGLNARHIRPISYRPFDQRRTFYTGITKGFHCMPRGEVMNQFVSIKNIGLAIGRAGAVIGDSEWNICFMSDGITEFNLFRRGGNNLFPLWLNDDHGQVRPNLNPKFLTALAIALGIPTDVEHHDFPQGVAPEDVLAYLYAVLHAPIYRTRYGEFLKSDFPRIPLGTADGSPFATVWAQLLPLGRELIDLHLLRHIPEDLRASFPRSGDNVVQKPRFELHEGQTTGRVWINATQYFDRVSAATWQHRIGGYQVCEKWLKDRKDRNLSLDDIEHYAKVVAVLTRTQAIMMLLDRAVRALLVSNEA